MANTKRQVILHRIEIRSGSKRAGELWLGKRIEWHFPKERRYFSHTWKDFEKWMRTGKERTLK